MYLKTKEFKFLDIKNYLAPGISYGNWCKAMKVGYNEWMTDFEKLDHKGPVVFKDFYSSLGKKITLTEYKDFCSEFHKKGCETMKDWLKIYTLADVEPFIEALEKKTEKEKTIFQG